jgi:hypothetical protein
MCLDPSSLFYAFWRSQCHKVFYLRAVSQKSHLYLSLPHLLSSSFFAFFEPFILTFHPPKLLITTYLSWWFLLSRFYLIVYHPFSNH